MDYIKNKMIILAIFIAVGYGVYQYFRPYNPLPQMLTTSQKIAIDKINAEMKPYCFGRYLLDLPYSFISHNEDSPLEKNLWIAVISRPENTYKTYLATQKMYYPDFVQLLALREKALRGSKTIDAQDMPFLKRIWPLPPGMDGVIFERNENEIVADAMRILEGYLYTNGVAIKLQKQSINDSSSVYNVQRGTRPVRNYVPRDISQMQSLMARISGRENNIIPTKPGSCISHAFIATDPTAMDRENISTGFESNTLENIKIILSTDNFMREENTVLDRAGDIESNLYRGHVERKGAFSVNELQAQEFLATGLQPYEDEPRYDFEMFINEMTASYMTPNLILTLENDSMPPTSYSQEEIITFWDTISRSVRIRPDAF